MNAKLVSVLTPAYNSGKFIHRLLDSILIQTYPKIEMFVIDDGSKDDTKDVIATYIPLFEEKGYTLTYVYQENSGQSVAINRGLKLIKGEYLVWPDSDDYYASKDAIEKMVTRLENAPLEFAMVRTQERLVDERSGQEIKTVGLYANEEEPASLFMDCLVGKMYFMPGGYMIRTSTFWEVNGNEIYTEKDAGQNWQIFLPILYRHRCLTIKDPLYDVVIRAASHSRGQYEGFKRTIVKIAAYERTIINTLDYIKAMGEEERTKCKNIVERQYASRRFFLAMESGTKDDVNHYYDIIKNQHGATTKEKYYRFSYYHPLLGKILDIVLPPLKQIKAKVNAQKPI